MPSIPPLEPAPAQLDLSQSASHITGQLCDIESVSGGEKPLADAIEEVLRRQAPHLTLTRCGNTIIARTGLGREHRVIIAGHIDTVPVNNNLPCRTLQENGEEVLWGRGTVDMKGGVAVQLKLAAELREPAYDVTWVWYDNEEVASHLSGLGRAMEQHPELFQGDFAVLGEPTAGLIEGGCNGTLRVRVTMRGKRAHSARAWMGVNAIHRMGEMLGRLASYQPETVTVDGLAYREGLNAVRAGGGVAGNVIPDECWIEVNYRFAPSRSAEEACEFVREFFADADELEFVDVAAGARPGLTAEFARSLVAAVGGEPRAKEGWTDVSRFSALGIPAVNYGPGDPLLAHADDERVPLPQVEECVLGMRRWLAP